MIKNIEKHLKIIDDFLVGLNRFAPRSYILKGGTALLYYDLDRFSEDIDLDALRTGSIKTYIKHFCKTNGFKYNTKKDTETVYRVMVTYEDGVKPLKIEVSLRNVLFDNAVINGDILMYNIKHLLDLKIYTLIGRYKLRDLFDVAYICSKFTNEINDLQWYQLEQVLRDRFPIEALDTLIQEQSDNILPQSAIELMVVRLLDLYENLDV